MPGAADHIRPVSLFGLAFKPLLSPLVTPTLYAGILFLCTLPSTVQSSIALTAIAKGNVPAAVCSASASSIIGIFVTPVVVSLVLAILPNIAILGLSECDFLTQWY